MATAYTGRPSTEKWQCELQGADVETSGRLFVDIEGLAAVNTAVIHSGDSTLFVENGEITKDGVLNIPTNAEITISRASAGRRGPAAANRSQAKQENIFRQEGRALTPLSQAKADHVVLAVRVKAKDYTTSASTEEIRDSIFGSDGDTSNLSERYSTCSYGELTMSPFNGQTSTQVSVVNGVYEVEIGSIVQDVNRINVANEVLSVLTSELGNLPAQFDHVMLCLPPNTASSLEWVAFGKSVT